MVSLCSRARHDDEDSPHPTADGLGGGWRKTLDLHTSEAPIETTNLDRTVDDLGLRECTVNGVLNIYAVERAIPETNSARGSGQDAIFTRADCWVCHQFYWYL